MSLSSSSSARGTFQGRLMPQVLDEIAEHHDRLYATVTLPDGTYQDVKFSQIAGAVNWLAHQIQNDLGLDSGSHETIAYIGANDLRYAIVFQAGVKCGYKVLLPSPRHTASTNSLLLESTTCSKLIYSEELSPKIQELQSIHKNLTTWRVPGLLELLEKSSKPFPYSGTFEERKWQPILVLHSSGSTGAPKPIAMNHATFAVADHDRFLTLVPRRRNQNYSMWDFPNGDGRFYSPFPAFHLAGFTAMVPLPIYANTTSVVLGPADRPPAVDVAMNIMKSMPIRALFCPPIIAEGLASSVDGLELVKKLKFLLYAGGPLSESAGTALSKLTDVCQFYGQTETGPIQSLIPSREDWAWLEWHPAQGVHMQPYIGDLFEMTMARNPELEQIRALSCNFPKEEVWHTKDLFRKHATKNIWQFAGRTDDIIVLSSGEKYNPVPVEVTLSSSLPGVKGALIVGQGRFSPALLLELATDTKDKTVADLWPQIEASNSKTPEYGRISRSLILFVDKPFERAAKGTVIRATTERLFETQIHDLYSKHSINTDDAPKLEQPITNKSLHTFVTNIVSHIARDKQVSDDTDIFRAGLDSLQILEVVNLLKHGLRLNHPEEDLSWLSASTIYNYPTPKALSDLLWHQQNADQSSKYLPDRTNVIQELVSRETKLIDHLQANLVKSVSSASHSVILTGCTGSLGVHVLHKLLMDNKIHKVYCLVRDSSAQDRLPATLTSLDTMSKVVFLKSDLGSPKLGLSSNEYDTLSQGIVAMIHLAWSLNFNQDVSSFDEQFIRGLKYLYEILAGNTESHFIFASSLSTVNNWKTTNPKDSVPEAYIPDSTVAAKTGYTQSKYVAESLCDYASQKLSTPTSVLRIGQIAAPSDTSLKTPWNVSEWVPMMLKTSKSLGMIPHDLPVVDWLPVNVVADIIHDLVNQKSLESKSQFFNVVNSSTVEFEKFIPTIQKALGKELDVVKLTDWIDQLKSKDQSDLETIQTMPAIKILGFFESLINRTPLDYDVAKLQRMSSSYKSVAPVNDQLMARWINDMQLGN